MCPSKKSSPNPGSRALSSAQPPNDRTVTLSQRHSRQWLVMTRPKCLDTQTRSCLLAQLKDMSLLRLRLCLWLQSPAIHTRLCCTSQGPYCQRTSAGIVSQHLESERAQLCVENKVGSRAVGFRQDAAGLHKLQMGPGTLPEDVCSKRLPIRISRIIRCIFSVDDVEGLQVWELVQGSLSSRQKRNVHLM